MDLTKLIKDIVYNEDNVQNYSRTVEEEQRWDNIVDNVKNQILQEKGLDENNMGPEDFDKFFTGVREFLLEAKEELKELKAQQAEEQQAEENKTEENDSEENNSEENKTEEHNSEEIKENALEEASAMDQFEIRDYFTFDAPILSNAHVSLTNIGLYISAAFIIIVIILGIINKLPKLFYVAWILFKECLYDTVRNVIFSQMSNKGKTFLPFIFTLFIFILINNLIGLIPYSFSATSHFLLAFSWSFTIVIGTFFLGVFLHHLKILALFVPQGSPLALVPFLILIEAISYITRNVSLGLRLAANMLSGHMLLSILSGFTFNIFKSGYLSVIGILPLLFIIAFSFLELGIAFIQAQVFIVLTVGYIKDSIYLH